MPPAEHETVSGFRRYLGILYIVAVIGICSLALTFRSPTQPTGVTDFDACAGRCLVVYLAPWCPACAELRPTLTALADDLMAEGVSVTFVVGDDSLQRCEDYAEGLPGTLHLDPKGEFSESARVKAFPTLFVIGKNGRLVKQLAGGYLDKTVLRRSLGL